MVENRKSYSKTANLVLCGLFAALTAICSYINLPLGFTPIPMNLATLAVLLAGGLLGKKYGTLSIIAYVLMGAAGIPVFAGFQSGLGVIAGPTGGFLLGYIAAAYVIGFLLDTPMQSYNLRLCMGSMALASAICYIPGVLWFMMSTKVGMGTALISCVLPFIAGDMIKVFVGSFLVKRLRPILR